MSLSKRILYNLNVTNGSLLSNNLNSNVGTFANLFINTFSGGNLNLSGNLVVGGTVTTVNITTTNLTDTNISVGTINVSSNATFGSNVIVDGPVLKIPSGDIASRPGAPAGGHIRYNTETQQFEGYGPGSAWGSLGGVVDIAQTTKILASESPSTTDGNLYFYTVGSERMRVNSTGNIGIGTTAPTTTLDVTGTARVTTSITTAALYSTNMTSTNVVATNVSIGTIIGSNINVTAETIGTLIATNTNVTNETVGTSRVTTSLMALGNSNTVGNIFTTGGNVGINIAAPSYHLDVNGNVHVNANLYVDGLISGGADTGSTFAYLTLTSTDDSINLSTGSFVTYGGVTIQSPTDAQSITNGGSFLTEGGASIGKRLFVGDGIVSASNTNTVGNLFTTGGNVGIGTTAPVAPLHVTGTMGVASATGNGIFMGTYTDGFTSIQLNSSTGNLIDFSTSGVDSEARIHHLRSNQSLTIMNNSKNFVFASTGNFLADGDVTCFNSLSDIRLKTNIDDITPDSGLETIKSIRPVTFNWRDDIFNESKRGDFDAGFIAQEIEELLPFMVTEYTKTQNNESELKYKALKHERIIPYLVAAIQKLAKDKCCCECNCKM